jgi:hypothetical protein
MVVQSFECGFFSTRERARGNEEIKTARERERERERNPYSKIEGESES